MNDNQEQKQLLETLSNIAMKKLNISKETATLRMKALLKSGVLSKLGNANELTFQIGVDVAMQIPQIGIEG